MMVYFFSFLFLFQALLGLDKEAVPYPNAFGAEVIENLSPYSLNRYCRNVHSQNGEDGIIEEIFSRLGIEKGFFVEFGASDGIWLSNTRNLWKKGWSGLMIEPDAKRFKQLKACYNQDPRITCLQTFIGYTQNDEKKPSIDRVLQKHFPGKEIDFISIDVDGMDYLILKSLKCRPKVIAVEANLFWHPLFCEKVPDHVAARNLQQPIPVMIETARELGYEPICLTINLFLVRRDLYEAFKETPSDAVMLYRDALRSNPEKKWIIEARKKSSLLQKYQPSELEKMVPIDENF